MHASSTPTIRSTGGPTLPPWHWDSWSVEASLPCGGVVQLAVRPYQKGGFHEQVVDAATEMKEGMSPNDDLLKLFFEDILLDLGESLENNTEARRRQYLQELPQSPIVKSKGPRRA